MKIGRIIIALILTVAMLYIARTQSKGQPGFYTTTDSLYTFEYHSVPKGIENSAETIPVIVKGNFSAGQKVLLRHNDENKIDQTQHDNFLAYPMAETEYNTFAYEVTTGDKGGRFYYYFEIVDSAGFSLATMLGEEDQPFVFKYIGEVHPVILISHIALIFATVFAIAMATMWSIPLITKGGNIKPAVMWIYWAAVFCFIGGYPVGFAMNWFAFGGLWEGIPFGSDATDNKTQLLFVYIIFSWLAALGSWRNKPEFDLFSPKAYGWIAGIGSFIVILFIYLIPHSIQFTKTLTYSFCYSWIIIIIIWYLIARSKKQKSLA